MMCAMPDNQAVASNTGVTPVTVDTAGRELGAGDYAIVNVEDKVTAAAIAAGKIGVVDEPDDDTDLDPSAAALFKHLAKSKPKTAPPPPAGTTAGTDSKAKD